MQAASRTVLYATDLSETSNRALPHALTLAGRMEAGLLLCHIIDLTAFASYGEGVLNPLEQEAQLVSAVEEQLRGLMGATSLPWEPLVLLGRPAEEIAHLAGTRSVDLVVAGTHGRTGLRRLFLGSVTERLMRLLPCPLFVVPTARPLPTADSPGLDRLLVGHDFSEGADRALSEALNLGRLFGSQIHLVHVVEPGTPPAGAQAEPAQLEARLLGRIPAPRREEIQVAILSGRPDQELVGYAARQLMDALVLGVHGHGLMERLFLGSTIDRVLRQALCPVLAVPPAPERD